MARKAFPPNNSNNNNKLKQEQVKATACVANPTINTHGPSPKKRFYRKKKPTPAPTAQLPSIPPQVTSRQPLPASPVLTSLTVAGSITENSIVKIVLPSIPRPNTKGLCDRPPHSGVCLFMERCPGEIRNKIYNIVIDGAFVAEAGFQFWIKGKKKNFRLDKAKPKNLLLERAAQDVSCFTTDPSYRPVFDFQEDVLSDLATMVPDLPSSVRNRSINEQQAQMHRSKRLLTPANRACFELLFTNKTIYNEVIPIIYSKCVFAFRHQWRLREMLFDHWKSTKAKSALRPRLYLTRSTPFPMVSLSWINSICLEIDSHNAPHITEMIRCEYRYYSEWMRTTIKIVELLGGLENITLFIHVPYRAPCMSGKLSFNELWVKPLAAFCHATTLKTAAIRLNSPTHQFPAILKAFAEYLRRSILRWDISSACEAIKSGKDEYVRAHPDAVNTDELVAWRRILSVNNIEDSSLPELKDDASSS